MSKKVRENPINPKHFYTLGEIVREELIPGVNTTHKAARLVRSDLLFNKVLQAKIVPIGRAIQYQVLGSNIIKFLVEKDHG